VKKFYAKNNLKIPNPYRLFIIHFYIYHFQTISNFITPKTQHITSFITTHVNHKKNQNLLKFKPIISNFHKPSSQILSATLPSRHDLTCAISNSSGFVGDGLEPARLRRFSHARVQHLHLHNSSWHLGWEWSRSVDLGIRILCAFLGLILFFCRFFYGFFSSYKLLFVWFFRDKVFCTIFSDYSRLSILSDWRDQKIFR
jgi:hypothetical protein